MSILTNNFYSVKNFKHESCPVCNNNDARCKPSHGDSILCWNTTASEVDEASWFIIADIDAGNSGMRGVMVAPRKNSDDEKEDPEILEYKRQQAKQRRSLELAHLPSVETRDRGYREILGAMTLSAKHSFMLKEKRGLNREQVQLAERLLWFKTWQAGIDCSENIAGIDPATESTRWLGGMFVSAIDQNGKILGGQIAADNTEVVGKYFWVSSLKVGGYGCNLPYTNSLPLFVRRHPDSTHISQVWLCEGGLKSAITALKAWETDINIVVVGTAMSARFSEQLLDILAELKPSDGVRILPDAGTVENLSILSGLLITIEQVKKNGYVPTIGWWDQWEKGESSQDIDDYLIAKEGDYFEIVWLTTSQFVSLIAPNKLTEAAKKNEPAPEVIPFEPQPKRMSSEAANDKAYKTYQKYCELDAPDVTKFGNILTSQPKLATDWNALNSDEDVPYDAGWEFYPPRPGEILFLKAGTGEGKSHLLAHWLNEYFTEQGCILLGYRNGLLYQQKEKINGLVHLRGEDSDGFGRLVDPYYRVAFCDASLHNEKVTGSCTHRKILVIDEVMSVINSLFLGSTCSNHRRRRLTVFTEMLQEADMIICLDAHLSNWCTDLLTHLSKKVKRVMQNKWRGQPRRVKMLMGTETNPKDKGGIRSDIMTDARNGKPIAVFSDTKHELETLNNMMIDAGIDHRSIARVDSSTSSEKWCIKLLENIDLYLENHPEIKVLLVSPSGDSGLDLSRVYFEHVYLILCGTLTIDSALQMYGRVRDRNVPRTVYCAKEAQFKKNGGITKAEIQNEMSLSIESQLRLIADGAEDSENLKSLLLAAVEKWQERERADKFLDAISLMLAKANFEKLYYRDLFIERLEKLGDIIEFVYEDGNPDTKKSFQEASLAVKYAEADKLVAAEEISEIEAESLRRKELNPEQTMQLKKFDLQHRIPGVEIDQGLAKTLLYDRDFLKGLEQRYYLSHPEISLEIAKLKWGNSLARREFFSSDMRSQLALRTDCLDKLGLLEFLDDREWLENGNEVKVLRQRWDALRKKYGAQLAGIMGFEWDKKNPIQTIYKLLDLVGCELRVIKAKSGEQKTGQKIKKRRISFGSLNDPTRLAILESFDKRFENLKSVDWQEVKTVCQNEIEIESELVTA